MIILNGNLPSKPSSCHHHATSTVTDFFVTAPILLVHYKLFVDPQSVEALEEKGAITFVGADGSVAAIGTKDKWAGDIFGVCKGAKSTARKAGVSLIVQSIAAGGNKLDCYGSVPGKQGLPGLYSSVGMIPVARVALNEQYADPDWNYERDGRPDVIFFMHNGDSADTVAQKYGVPESEGGYHKYTDEELADLPLFDDYDEAWDYKALPEQSIGSAA